MNTTAKLIQKKRSIAFSGVFYAELVQNRSVEYFTIEPRDYLSA